MPEKNSSRKKTLPQSYYHCNSGNTDTLQQCIRDARLAARSPDAPPAERHLHRIVASAGLESLHHTRSSQGAPARRADRLVSEAVRQLENIRLEVAP